MDCPLFESPFRFEIGQSLFIYFSRLIQTIETDQDYFQFDSK